MRRPTFVLLALASLAAASCDGGPTTAARGPELGDITIRGTGTANATATGAFTFTFGASTQTQSFAVVNDGSSNTTGFATFYSHNADVVAAIQVTCLNVTGTNPKTATFLGTIIESSDPLIEGNDAWWQVIDGTPDQASLVNLAESGNGPSCTTPGEFDHASITRGAIILTN
jgi:hypothetical protein